MRYDNPKATPEYIARERARKRLVNRREFVEKWWPRIEAEVREGASHENHSETF